MIVAEGHKLDAGPFRLDEPRSMSFFGLVGLRSEFRVQAIELGE
jgi:hypothetical protein